MLTGEYEQRFILVVVSEEQFMSSFRREPQGGRRRRDLPLGHQTRIRIERHQLIDSNVSLVDFLMFLRSVLVWGH